MGLRRGLDWLLLDFDKHKKLQQFSKELNHFYKAHPELWEIDYSWEGFSWISSDDNRNSTIAFRRMSKEGKEIIGIFNFTPVEHEEYRIGVPDKGTYKVIFDSNLKKYGGGKARLSGTYKSAKKPMHGFEQSIGIKLGGLNALFLEKTTNRLIKEEKFMARKSNVVAMLLAGGQGSRLGVLTKNIAKPAVPYGGKYRIIDFPLSNCVNSGIYTVGVLTQYQPLELNDYLGNGQPWDLDRQNGGVHVLSPYEAIGGAEWYKGTANAIYQNINFIEKYDPEYVVILSGDHIYKMNYAKMIDFHKKNDAACTIAVLEVPWEEASRFGILATDDTDRIYEFAEKPAEPKSNKASMGVYVFSWDKLKQYLIQDENTEGSANDFGKNIIPAMLNANEKMFAFPFKGYWKDVGTIDSLWEANLDIINPNVDLDLSDKSWRIYSRNPMSPPHYIGSNAIVENSSISEGCEIEGNVDYSVIFSDVTIEDGADVRYSVIMPGATIKKGAKVYYSIVAENAVVEEDAKIGEIPEHLENPESWGIAVIGSDAVITSGKEVQPGVMIKSGEEV